MEIVELVCRILLGLNFLVFGLNEFVRIVPIPPAEKKMKEFLQALEKTGVLMPTIKIVEIVAGVLLLTNCKPLFGLILLFPIVLVITLSQLILNKRRGYGITAFTLTPYLVLGFIYFDKIKLLLNLV